MNNCNYDLKSIKYCVLGKKHRDTADLYFGLFLCKTEQYSKCNKMI